MQTQALSSLVETLTARGFRLTRQRRIVLETLDNASAHLNAKDLLRLARERDERINRATVYRTVGILKKAGLIDELDLMHLEGEQHYYERRRSSDHVHICCVGCGRIQEMETDLVADLVAEIRERMGFETTTVRIEVKARCPICQAQP